MKPTAYFVVFLEIRTDISYANLSLLLYFSSTAEKSLNSGNECIYIVELSYSSINNTTKW